MRSRIRLLVLACGLPALATCPAASADTPSQIYNRIKNQEPRITVPVPVGTGTVGTFDVRTGKFRGLRTQVLNSVGPDGKPHSIEIHPALEINGVRARLRFRFRHVVFKGSVTLTVRGKERVPEAGRRSVSVGVGRARNASWSITTAQGVEVSDQVRIRRPRIIGAGAFVVEAVPVAVIYVPPQPVNPELRNSASYVRSSDVGTRITTSFTREDSTTIPTTPFGFASDEDFKAKIGGLGGALSAIPGSGPEAQAAHAAGGALTAMSSAMGSATGTSSDIRTQVRQRALEISLTNELQCDSAAREGPGVGDGIVFLEGVRLVWLDDGTRSRLALLGADNSGCKSVRHLRAALARLRGPAAPPALCLAPNRTAQTAQAGSLRRCRHGMSAETIQALLDQDPFVAGGPQAALPPDRFERVEGIIADEDFVRTKTLEVTVGEDDLDAHTFATVDIDEYSKGFLSILGFGPSETKRVATTITTTSATTARVGQVVKTRVRIEGPPPGTDTLDVYYDRVFGTFALQAANGA